MIYSEIAKTAVNVLINPTTQAYTGATLATVTMGSNNGPLSDNIYSKLSANYVLYSATPNAVDQWNDVYTATFVVTTAGAVFFQVSLDGIVKGGSASAAVGIINFVVLQLPKPQVPGITLTTIASDTHPSLGNGVDGNSVTVNNMTFSFFVEDITVDIGTFDVLQAILDVANVPFDRFAGELNTSTVTVNGYDKASNNCIGLGALPDKSIATSEGNVKLHYSADPVTASQEVTYTVTGILDPRCHLTQFNIHHTRINPDPP